MTDNIKLYKNISLEIIALFKNNEIDNLECLLEKRQEILNQEFNNEGFKESLINDGILEIDKDIHGLLTKSIDEVKEEIKIHRRSNVANNSYINFNKENLNIFNKKV